MYVVVKGKFSVKIGRRRVLKKREVEVLFLFLCLFCWGLGGGEL
jgi:hypothetical protein